MNQLLFFAALLVVAVQTGAAKPTQIEEFAATGAWNVISQTSGPSVLAIPDNKIYLSDGLFAEYDRSSPKRTLISLFNVQWKGEGPNYSTPLYRSPANSLHIDRFSEDNIAAFCYLQIRADSAVMVISTSKIEGEPFVSNGPTAILDANARMLTLARVDTKPKPRATHLAAHAKFVTDNIGGEMLHYRLQRAIGGFLEEHKASSAND